MKTKTKKTNTTMKKNNNCLKPDITEVRKGIDEIDSRLVEILVDRLHIVEMMGVIKRKADMPIRDLKRENTVIKRVTAKAGKKYADAAKRLYRELIAIARDFEDPRIKVRPAMLKDAEKIYELISQNSDKLVPRSLGSVVESIDRFYVAECGGKLAGCASFQIHPEIGKAESATVEIVSLAVKNKFRRCKVGSRLVETIIDHVSKFAPREVVVLTYVPKFFKSLKFVTIPKTAIMHKLYTGCINCTKHADPYTCPETAMKRPL